MEQAQQLLHDIVSNPVGSNRAMLANQLLREFHRGYPIENLVEMLRHEHEEVVKAGIWILSEVGGKARPLLEEACLLLTHPSRYVRFFAIDCILTCATGAEPHALAAVVSMLSDTDGTVRRKALDFLCRASAEQLEAAIRHHKALDPNTVHTDGLGWVIRAFGFSQDEVLSFPSSENPLVRRYGVVVAARAACSRELLRVACKSNDEDIRQFALQRLELEPGAGKLD